MPSSDELLADFQLTACDEHPGEKIKVYCLDCHQPSCIMCYIKNHNMHNCSDINKVARDFCRGAEADAVEIGLQILKYREVLENLESEHGSFVEQVRKTETEIGAEAEKLERLMERHKTKLFEELGTTRQGTVKVIQRAIKDVGQHVALLESYKKYMEEVHDKGTAYDLARDAIAMHQRARELLEYDLLKHVDTDFKGVSFVMSEVVTEDWDNVVGKLVVQRNTKGLFHTLKPLPRIHTHKSVSPIRIYPGWQIHTPNLPFLSLVFDSKVSTENVLTGQRWPTLYKSLLLDTQHNYSAMALSDG
jgi:hypothetical protein